MANEITIADFTQPFMVFAPSGSDEETFLNQLITYYQKDILTQILGEIEYNDYVTNRSNTEWDEFVDGDTYVHDDITYVYPGIKPVLTNLMYYYWNVETASNLGESGALKRSLVNAVQVVPRYKMVRAFNDAVADIFNNRTYSPTVYNFLLHKQEDEDYFPDWEYTQFYKINQWNL